MQLPHRIARARGFASIVVFAVIGQAAPPAVPDPEPTFYICQVMRTGAFGHVSYQMNVPVDGTAPFHRGQWQIPDRDEGLRLRVQWDGAAPVDGRLDDRAWMFVHFLTARRVSGQVRIEIRRMPGERYAPELAYAGQYQRLHRWPESRLHAIGTQGRWGELNAWMSGRESLTFALVRRDGMVVAEDRLEAATIASGVGAIAAARSEVEAMALDYRHRCEVGGPIVIT